MVLPRASVQPSNINTRTHYTGNIIICIYVCVGVCVCESSQMRDGANDQHKHTTNMRERARTRTVSNEHSHHIYCRQTYFMRAARTCFGGRCCGWAHMCNVLTVSTSSASAPASHAHTHTPTHAHPHPYRLRVHKYCITIAARAFARMDGEFFFQTTPPDNPYCAAPALRADSQ